MTPIVRFLSHIRKTNTCWLWIGAKFNKGPYGQQRVGGRKGKVVLVHRRAYELFVGPIPDGMDILHSCDNGLCVNPSHLRPGTNAENVADRVARGRSNKASLNRGTSHPQTHLTENDIVAIRKDNRKQRAISLDYGITVSNVSAIQCKKSWRHVK